MTDMLAVLRCPGCRGGGLLDRGRELECPGCRRVFPVQGGVPVMVGDAVLVRGAFVDPGVADALMHRFGIPAGPVEHLRVRHATGARVRVPPGSGGGLRDGRVLVGVPGAPEPAPPPWKDGRLQCAWTGDYVPRAMPPGADLDVTVRFRNAGGGGMRATGDGRVTVAARWDGGEADEVRTPLPVDLRPGEALTWSLRIRTPAAPGRHELTLQAVAEGLRWLEPAYGPLHVLVSAAAGFAPPAHWQLDGLGPRDPAGDRARAAALLLQWAAQSGRSRPLVLEVGWGGRPVAAPAGLPALCADADLLALQLGRLLPGPAAPAFCAPLDELPLAEDAFDAVFGLQLLHDLSDPVRVLGQLRTLLRPNGFIGLVCEPVGPPGFSLQDMAAIFGRAGLRAAELVVDGTSLKVRLVR